MRNSVRWLSVIVLCLYFAAPAEATLYVRGTGTISGFTGEYQLIYDDLLDITWLDFTPPRDSWYNQTNWAAGLEVSFTGQTYDDWRLPQTLPVNGVSYDYNNARDGSTDRGYNISAPGSLYPESTGSEMAHLFYTSLENLGYYDVDGNDLYAGWGLQNTGPFENLQSDSYWSGTAYAPSDDGAWHFLFHFGDQHDNPKDYNHYALAVLPGDIAALPIPGAVWLFGSGIIGIGALRSRFGS